MALHVAYLVNQYPSISHTFIRREIHALERQGIVVHRIAVRGWNLPLVDDTDRSERQRTRYVLQGGAKALAGALLRTAVRAPARLAHAVQLAWRCSRGAQHGFFKHLAYLAEACVIQQWLADVGATHLHAHFATNPAKVAMFVHALGGPSYSFTAHGSDIVDRPSQMGFKHTIGHAAFVVAVCSFGRSQIFKWVPHRLWDRIKVVRCGLDKGYGQEALPPDGSVRRLLCIGRLSAEKGQLLLVEAAARLAQQGVPFELVLAGDGPMRGEIEALARQRGIAQHVSITGWLDAAGIEAQLRSARALVLPSLSEGLPVVIMEAMANQRPVVAPYLAGIPELVTPRTGWLFPAGDVDALAAAMKACLDASDDTLKAMAAAGREQVWASHDIDAEAGKLAVLFHPSAMSQGVGLSTAPQLMQP